MKDGIATFIGVFAIIVALLVLTFWGEYRHNTRTHSEDITITEWISPDGVHYWYYRDTYHGLLAPRYNSNGDLVIE